MVERGHGDEARDRLLARIRDESVNPLDRAAALRDHAGGRPACIRPPGAVSLAAHQGRQPRGYARISGTEYCSSGLAVV